MSRESRKFDVRTMERFLRDGNVTEEEYQSYLDSLPDTSEKAVPMEAEFVPGILEEDQEDEDQEES